MNAPKSATHYLPAPNGRPQMFYRIGTVRLNTGETVSSLEYFSSFDIWQGSFDSDRDGLLSRLVKLPEGTP